VPRPWSPWACELRDGLAISRISYTNDRTALVINRKLQARRIAAWQFAAYLLAACAIQTCESAEPERVMVEVKFRVVEVATTKLRSVGFDWHTISGDESLREPPQFGKFLEALAENNLAKTLAEPMIATMSGRQASLNVANRMIGVTPTAMEDDRIRLEYRIATQIPARNGQATPFESASTTELKSGEAHLLSETHSQTYDGDGKKHETTIYVVAEAKTVKR
jgi:hypothetical protein